MSKLNNVELGVSAIMKSVCIYIPEKNGIDMKEKKDVTAQFKNIAKSLGYIKKEKVNNTLKLDIKEKQRVVDNLARQNKKLSEALTAKLHK